MAYWDFSLENDDNKCNLSPCPSMTDGEKKYWKKKLEDDPIAQLCESLVQSTPTPDRLEIKTKSTSSTPRSVVKRDYLDCRTDSSLSRPNSGNANNKKKYMEPISPQVYESGAAFSLLWNASEAGISTPQKVDTLSNTIIKDLQQSYPWGIDIDPPQKYNFPQFLERFIQYVMDPHDHGNKRCEPLIKHYPVHSYCNNFDESSDMNFENLKSEMTMRSGHVKMPSIIPTEDNIIDFDCVNDFTSDIKQELEYVKHNKGHRRIRPPPLETYKNRSFTEKKLYCFKLGTGPKSVLLLHGLLMTSNFWVWGILKYFSDATLRHYNFICPDLVGYGQSVGLPRETFFTVEEQANRVMADVVSDCIEGTFHIVAHSFGCLIACEIIKRIPNRIGSILFLAPAFFSSSQKAREYIRRIPFPANLIISNPHFTTKALLLLRIFRSYVIPIAQKIIPVSEIPSVAVADFFGCDPNAVNATVHELVHNLVHSNLQCIAEFRKKIKIIHPEGDSMIPMKDCIEVVKEFSEFIEFEVMHNAQHHFPLAQAPEVAKMVEVYFSMEDCRSLMANSSLDVSLSSARVSSSLCRNPQSNL